MILFTLSSQNFKFPCWYGKLPVSEDFVLTYVVLKLFHRSGIEGELDIPPPELRAPLVILLVLYIDHVGKIEVVALEHNECNSRKIALLSCSET